MQLVRLDKCQQNLVPIHCIETEDYWGADDIYIKVNGNHVWGPTKINDDQWRDVYVDVTFNTTAEITLHEKDEEGDDDLGGWVVHEAELNLSGRSAVFNGDGAKYVLGYEVVEEQPTVPVEYKYTLKLGQIHCIETEDYWGADDIYIRVNWNHVWGPTKINDDQWKDVYVDVPFNTTALIKLYERDWITDDNLGEWVVQERELNMDGLKAIFHSDDANYELTYQVVKHD